MTHIIVSCSQQLFCSSYHGFKCNVSIYQKKKQILQSNLSSKLSRKHERSAYKNVVGLILTQRLDLAFKILFSTHRKIPEKLLTSWLIIVRVWLFSKNSFGTNVMYVRDDRIWFAKCFQFNTSGRQVCIVVLKRGIINSR